MKGLCRRATWCRQQQILDDSLRLVRQYHQRGAGAQIQIALAPCSPFSVTEEIMVESAKPAAELDVRLHTHLAETLDEEAFCLERFVCATRRLSGEGGLAWGSHPGSPPVSARR